jgi:cell division septation protein DedD
MKMKPTSQSAFLNLRLLVGFVLGLVGVLLSLFAFGIFPGAPARAEALKPDALRVGVSYHNDVSQPMRDMPSSSRAERKEDREREANENPKVPYRHQDSADPVIQDRDVSAPGPGALNLPTPILNFDGIPFPGVGCNCAPADTNGAVGQTQYVQIVNEGYQVFNKATGSSILGPKSIASVWTGFGGLCETSGHGDPVMLYDHLANRWIISQFAGASGPITDECVAVSTTADATGTYNRYGFHLGTNFFDYPHLSVWPDGYYMSMNVFNAAGTSYLGPQAFAFDRAKMLAGQPATFISPVGPLGGSIDPFLPADLDGSTLPPPGAPNTFVGFPGQATSQNYTTYHFHVDFATPANSTFTTFATPPAAGYTALCPTTRACVPQKGVAASSNLDGIGDRLMFRLAYRNFGTHESVVGTYSVSAGGVAALRWFELRNVTAGPVTVFQQSTYQPDSTWRWMGSAAMDGQGNLAIGFSASSSTINPQLRYAARLASDPLNTLSQGEAHLFDGAGSQSGSGNRWGDYSSLSIDPVDDSTFWFTSEYYSTTATFNWRTRIGSFKITSAVPTPTPTPSSTPTPATTPTPTPVMTPTPTPAATATPSPTPVTTPTPTPTPVTTPTPTPTPIATPTPSPTPNYSISISPSSVSVPRTGGTATYTLTITRTGGFSSPVTFTISGLPSGTTPTFTPNPASGNTSTLRITVSASTRRGTYPFTVTGKGGTPLLTRTATATLIKRSF